MAARRREAKRRNWPAHLNQNGSGYFYWRDPDTKKDHGLGRDQARAFAEARGANAEVEKRRGNFSLAQKISEPTGKTLIEWSDEYQAIYKATRNPTESTLRTIKAGVKASISAAFAKKHLRKITTEEVSVFIGKATEERGAQMAKLIRKTLKDMFREAEAAGLIAGGANPVTVTRTPLFEVERSRLTFSDFQAVYEEALKGPPWEARAMELAIVTGQRREDIAGMKFSDAKDGFLFVTQTKTGMKLRIPLSLRLDPLGISIEDVIKNCRDAVISPWLVHHSKRLRVAKPGDAVDKDSLTRSFMKNRIASKIQWEEGRTAPSFHEMRSLAARLYTDQYNAEFAQALLGHKSANMTAIYRDTRGSEWVEVKLAG